MTGLVKLQALLSVFSRKDLTKLNNMTSSGGIWPALGWLQKHPWHGPVAPLSCECGTWKKTELTIQSRKEMRKEIERLVPWFFFIVSGEIPSGER